MKRFTLVLASLFLVMGAMAQINYGKRTWTFPATEHAAVETVPEKIFTDFAGQYAETALTNAKVGVFTTDVRVNAEGNVTATFAYNGGNVRMDISGVDLVNAEGAVVYSDYHFGYTGGNSDGNTYTLTGVAVGDYTMRLFVAAQKEDITSATNNDSKGKITIAGAWMYPSEGVYYNIKNIRSTKYATFKGEGQAFAQETANNGAGSYWYFVEASLDDVKAKENATLVDGAIPAGFRPYWVYTAANTIPVENAASGRLAAADADWYPAKIYYIGAHTYDSATGLVVRPCNEDGASWNDYGSSTICNYSYNDGGSLWSIEVADVNDNDLKGLGTTARDNALNAVIAYEQAYYFKPTTAEVNAAKAAINNVDCSTVAKALTSVIDGVAASYAAELSTKTIAPADGDRFMLKNRGRSGNNYLCASANGDVKCTDFGNNVNALDLVWTLKASGNDDNHFKLYNERLGVYVGALSGSNNTKMQYTTDAAAAGLYEVSQDGVYTLFHAKGQDGAGYMHQSNWGGKEIVRWDNGDCSQWQLIDAPIELTTDVENPICYAIKSGRDNNYYFTLESNKIKLVNNADIVGNANAQWFFMLDADKNLKIYPYADKDNSMGYITVADGNTKLTNDHNAQGFVADTYTLYYNTNNAADNNGKCFAFRPTEGNSFVSNHGGTGNYMGFYNENNDKGTRIGFELINDVVVEQKVAAWEQYFAHEGDKVCQYAIADGVKDIVDAAALVAATKASTAAQYKDAAEALNGLTFPTINLPTTGHYYRIATGNKYVQAENSGVVKDNMNTLLISDAKDAASVFYYANGQLLSYKVGTYVNENGSSARGLKDIGGVGGAVTFAAGHSIGTITVAIPSYMHANSSNGVQFIDHCGSDGGHTAHDFVIEEVDALPVTITAAGYATLYAPVALTIADGVKAYAIKVEGSAAVLNEITGVIPANTGVVLEGTKGAYNFVIAESAEAVESDLRGSVAATYYTEAGTYYALGIVDEVVGFYRDEFANSRFQNNSHKAYLYVPGSNNVASYSFRFPGTTGVEEVEVENAVKAIYDLTGRKVNEITAPGIYIVGGKKVLVK